MKKRKKRLPRWLGYTLIALGAVATGAWFIYLLRPINSPEWRIVYSEADLQYRDSILAAAPNDSLLRKAKRPNIIILLADDLGAYETSAYGGKELQTKHIDALAARGVLCQEAYITSPICAPSRAGLITGRYQQRFGFELNIHERYPRNRLEHWVYKSFIARKDWRVARGRAAAPSLEDMLKQGLPPTELTLAELLKKQGYNTAAIGKWHMGYSEQALPMNRGFDYHYGFYEAFSLYAPKKQDTIINHYHKNFSDKHIWRKARKGNCAIRRNGEEIEENRYLTNVLAEEACQWMRTHRDAPFFLYLPFSAPHTPFQATKHYYDMFAHVEDENKRVYYAMIQALDDAIGRVVQEVADLGIEEETLIIFLSDNGGATYTLAADNSPLREGKFSNFEGGIRVPMIWSWPGHLPEGRVESKPISALDIAATVLPLAGAEEPTERPLDGFDIFEVLKGEQALPERKLYWRSLYQKAIRSGDWKLFVDELGGSLCLYNIAEDQGEKRNLAQEHPSTVAKLRQELAQWEEGLIAPRWPRVMDYRIQDNGFVYYFPL